MSLRSSLPSTFCFASFAPSVAPGIPCPQARAALHRLLLMDSHFGTYTRAIKQIVGLIERIKAAANAEQLSEAEVEHFDQVRSMLKSLVPGELSCGVGAG